MNYIETIRQILLDMIVADEIEYKYDEVQKLSKNDVLQLSSMDKVKVVIEIENHFDVSVDDNLLGKLDTLEDFERIVATSLRMAAEQKEQIENLRNEVFPSE